MAKRNRDDFSPQVKRTLASRVGLRCSNPDCRVPTMGPTTKAEGVSSIGKAAHIAAAAGGGPRYESSMTAAQRGGIGNGIWLCSNCADMIDRDDLRYSAKLLHDWRRQAEASAQSEQGRKLPSERELAVFRAKALGDNVTGKSIGELITGVHAIGVREIERIDPRFTAKITIDHEGTPIISLNPLEPVNCRLCIPLEAAQEFSEKLANLQNHGRRLEIDAAGITIEGTPLLENTFPPPEKLVMEANLRCKALQRVTWTDVESGKPKTAEFLGQIIAGAESITFSGDLFGGLYHVKYQIPMTSSGMVKVKTEAMISFSSWEGRAVRYLPYLGQFLSLCEAISEGQQIGTCLEVEGRELTSFASLNLMTCAEAMDMRRVLDYVTKVRDILEALRTDINFQTFLVPADDAKRVAEIWFWLCRMKHLRGKELGLTGSITIVPSKAGIEVLKESLREGKAIAIRVEQQLGGPLNLLGQAVPLNAMSIIWTHVVPKIQGRLSSIRAGKSTRLQLVPTDDCTAEVFAENKPPPIEAAPSGTAA